MAKSAHELVAERFGVRARVLENPAATSVGTSSVVVARRNPNRYVAVFMNIGATNIFLRPNRAATVTAGVRLAANGGSLSMDVETDFILPAQEWNAIGDSGGGVLFILFIEGEPGGEEDE